jgi:hypothetical protein
MYKIITDYIYDAVTDAHGENNHKLDMDFCCDLLCLLYESDNTDLVLSIFRRIKKEGEWGINKENDTPDSILNYWCARANEALMFEVAKDIYGYDE